MRPNRLRAKVSVAALALALMSTAAEADPQFFQMTRTYQDLGVGPLTIAAAGAPLQFLIADARPKSSAVGFQLRSSSPPIQIPAGARVWAEASGPLIGGVIVNPGGYGAHWPGDVLPVILGGTGADNAPDARSNLDAAKAGINADITQILGLSVPLSVAQGGCGATTEAGCRAALGLGALATQSTVDDGVMVPGAAARNLGFTPLNPASNLTDVANFDAARAALNAAMAGGNADITSLHKLGFYSILESGAACNAYTGSPPTDDRAALQTWMNSIPRGAVVYFPGDTQCLFNSGDLTIPEGVQLFSAISRPGRVGKGGNPVGGGFAHPPTVRLLMSAGNVFTNVGVWRSLDDGYFHISPTVAQAQADVYQWWNEYSEGITYPVGTGIAKLNGVFVEGFHVCLAQYTAGFDLDTITTDCPTSVAGFGSGDGNFWRAIRNEPVYSGLLPQTSGAWQRYGASFYFGDGASAWLGEGFQSEGFPMAVVTAGSGALKLGNVFYEYQANWNPGSPDYPSEVGVCMRIASRASNVVFSGLRCASGGSPGLFKDGILVDGTPTLPQIVTAQITSIPSDGNEIYVSGATAVPVTETITAKPSVGTIVSFTITGPANGPYTVSYPVHSWDTTASIAQHIVYLLNTQNTLMARDHITADQSGATVRVFWPSDVSYSVSVTGATVTAGTGTAYVGSSLVVSNLDLTQSNSGGIVLGNSTSGASYVSIDTPIYSVTNGALPANWLSFAVAPSRLILKGIPWSAVRTSNLGGTGGSGAAVFGYSTDAKGAVTEGNNSTGFALSWTTPYPADPFCEVWGGPGTFTADKNGLTAAHPAQSGVSYGYRCDLEVRQ